MVQSTFALTSGRIILGFKLATMITSILLETRPSLRERKKFDQLPQFISGLMGSIAIFLGLAMYFKNPNTFRNSEGGCMIADADIVGVGVKAATWTQFGILAFIAFYGMFSNDHSAIQEVGAGLLVTHVALAIALLVPAFDRKLSPIDSILGTMILDAQNSALSIQLVAKQTLASRWQTYLVILGQLAGLTAIGILIGNFTKNGLAIDECDCVSAFWWGWLNNCAQGTGDNHQAIWTYYALRAMTVLESCVAAGRHTFSFDAAQKLEGRFPCAKCRRCAHPREPTESRALECCKCVICNNCKYCHKCKLRASDCRGVDPCAACITMTFEESKGWFRGRKYSQLPASTSALYIDACAYSLLSLLAAEGLLATYSVRPSSPLNAVGQITSVVIAVATGIRALWVFVFMFVQEDDSETASSAQASTTASLPASPVLVPTPTPPSASPLSAPISALLPEVPALVHTSG